MGEEDPGQRTEKDILPDRVEEGAVEAGGKEGGGSGPDDEKEEDAGEIANDRAGELLQAAEREAGARVEDQTGIGGHARRGAAHHGFGPKHVFGSDADKPEAEEKEH